MPCTGNWVLERLTVGGLVIEIRMVDIVCWNYLLVFLVTQKMLTQASRSSWVNSGTSVSGIPSGGGVSTVGRRDST